MAKDYWLKKLENAYDKLMNKKHNTAPVIETKPSISPCNPPVSISPSNPPSIKPVNPPEGEYQDINEYNSEKDGYVDSTIPFQDFSDAARRNYFNHIKPAVTARQKALFVQHQKQLKKGAKALDKQIKDDKRSQLKKERKQKKKAKQLYANGPVNPPKSPVYHV